MTNYKKEFNDRAIEAMTYLFSKWEKNNLLITYGKREKTISDTYGFPYTSSGVFAGIWNTNVEARLREDQQWKFDGLGLTENNQVIAIFSNDSEIGHTVNLGHIIPTE